MWPWGHLAIGYFLYTGYRWIRFREPPTGWPILALALGTQFPDLVDKRLAYWVGILPEGRSLLHSYLLVGPLGAATVALARRNGVGVAGTAFVIGLLSHPITDGLAAIQAREFDQLSYLVWPVLPAPDYIAQDFGYHWVALLEGVDGVSLAQPSTLISDPFIVQLWLGCLLVLLWGSHGMPPLQPIMHLLRKRIATVGIGNR